MYISHDPSVSNTLPSVYILQDIQKPLLNDNAQHWTITLTTLCSWKWTLFDIELSKSVIATGNSMKTTVLIPTYYQTVDTFNIFSNKNEVIQLHVHSYS